MLIKIHEGYRKTVALSDKELLNKTFTQDKREIVMHPHFFEGEEKTRQEIIEILKDMQKEDATFNIVGEKSIQTALEAGIIKEQGIMKIDNIPIALILL